MSDYGYAPDYGPRDRSLRVGDRERDAVGDALRQAHLEGRLDADEFQARLDRAMAAKTYAELDELIADFPSASAETQAPRATGYAPAWRRPFLVLPLAVTTAVVIGAGHFPWFAIPLLFLAVTRGCGPRRMRVYRAR